MPGITTKEKMPSVEGKKDYSELIKNAESLDDLYGIIKTHKITLQGTQKKYTHEDLLEIIAQVKRDAVGPNTVTRAEGFRDKVVVLHYKEKMWKATSLEELHDLIGEHKIELKGSKRIFAPEVLQEQIQKVIDGEEIKLDDFTRASGFRDLVIQLLGENRIKKK